MPKISHNQPEVQVEPAVVETKLNLRPDLSFKLPDGREVVMGKPLIPSAMLLPTIIASLNSTDQKSDPARNEFNARMAIFVRSVAGKTTILPQSAQQVGDVMRDLGEDGCDLVLDVYFKHFAPLSADQLEIVKK